MVVCVYSMACVEVVYGDGWLWLRASAPRGSGGSGADGFEGDARGEARDGVTSEGEAHDVDGGGVARGIAGDCEGVEGAGGVGDAERRGAVRAGGEETHGIGGE
jgi:hypothetical protein|mmetsp:Transcript_4837/g.15772  ORF Transcript_4837/g.15772 Transcript_4837/m.15772 type:complete len:104 (+) Transcript_4837:15-326(+)